MSFRPSTRRSWSARILVAAVLLAALIAAPVFAQTAADRPPDQFFDSDGVPIRFVEKGSGEPLLLIHGFSVNLEFQWGAHLDTLAEHYRVIAYDARGHGKSGKPHGPENYGAAMVEDAVRLLDHLGLEKARVMGYSMGGAVTLNLVARHPDRLVSAIIGGNGWPQPGDEMEALIETIATGLENGEGIKPLIRALNPEGRDSMTEEQVNQFNALAMSANDPIALASAARGFPAFTVEREALAANAVPTAILIGSVDPLRRLVPPAVEAMANLQVVVLEGDDHVTAPRNPDFYVAALAFFAGEDPNTVLAAARASAAESEVPEVGGAAAPVATVTEDVEAPAPAYAGAATAVAGTEGGVNPALLPRW